MNFPFVYTGELVLYKPESFNQQAVEQKLHNLNQVKSLVSFYLRVKTSLIADDQTSIQIKYRISLFELNILFLFFLLFGLFFYWFDRHLFCVISIIAAFVFYFFNLAHVSRKTKDSILHILAIGSEIEENQLWKKQQVWMKDKTLCPACGEPKNPYAYKCVNCGIYFKKSEKQKSTTYSVTDKNISINYNHKRE